MFTRQQLDKLVEQGKIRGYNWPKGAKAKKKNKYGSEKVIFDGMEFDSKKEASRYYDLKLMSLSGTITKLRRQVEYELEHEGKKIASYIADFVYMDGDTEIVEDVKSKATRKLSTYRLKRKMMKIIHGIEIQEV